MRLLALACLLLAPPAFGQVAAVGPEDGCDRADSQVALTACAREALARADAELNAVYARVLTTMPESHRADLRAAQRAWIQFRDLDCDTAGSASQGRSVEPYEFARCLTDHTTARTATLQSRELGARRRSGEARDSEGDAVTSTRCPVLTVAGPEPTDGARGASYSLLASDPLDTTVYPLRSLLEQVGGLSGLDAANADAWQALSMDFNVALTPGYRLDGACDRLLVENLVENRTLEVFPTWERGGPLVLLDSLGRVVDGPAVSSGFGRAFEPDEGTRSPSRHADVRFDASTGEPSVVTGAGRYPLSQILPFGRWHARPAGVRYRGADLVVVHACDPYDVADAFCDLDNDGERPLADPPNPLVTSFGLFATDGGWRLEAWVVEDDAAGLDDVDPLWRPAPLVLRRDAGD